MFNSSPYARWSLAPSTGRRFYSVVLAQRPRGHVATRIRSVYACMRAVKVLASLPDLEPGVGAVLQARRTEARRCLDSRTYLAAIAMMGGLHEGRLLVVCQRNPKSANAYVATPTWPQSVKVKRFLE